MIEREPGAVRPAEGVGLRVGLVAQLDQKMVICAPRLPVAGFAVVSNVAVFDPSPFLEPVLRKNLVAQMPLAQIRRAVIRISQKFRETEGLLLERNIILDTLGFVRPQTRHDRGPRRRAHRLSAISPFENRRLGSEFVQVGSMDSPVAVNRQRVGALFIRPKEEQVRFVLSRGAHLDRRPHGDSGG
jgi:hypothetical protein